MGNCLRNVSPTASNDHHHHRFPTPTYVSSTVYYSTQSHFPQTVAEGNKSPHPSVRDVRHLKAFTFAELKTATGNFTKQNLPGEGGFGKVFKGWIDERTFAPSKPGSGMVVAVKKIKLESLDQLGKWESEVSFLGRLSHPNLKLLGLCSENVEKTKELLLVYEFVPHGSLADHLFRSKD